MLGGKLTLLQKISVSIMLGLVIGAVLFSWIGVRALTEGADRIVEERVTTARLVASHVDEMLNYLSLQVANASRSRGPQLQDIPIEEIETLRNTFSQLGIVAQSVFILDEKGRVVATEPQWPGVITLDMSGYPSINKALEGEATISGLLTVPFAQKPAVLIASPVRGEDQRIIGVLGAAVDMEGSSIGRFIQPITLGKTGYAEIVDENGVVLAKTQPEEPPIGFERSDRPEHFVKLISENIPARRTCYRCHGSETNPQRERDVLAFAPLPSAARWGVAVRQSEKEALAPVDLLRTRLFGLGALIGGIALLFAWVTTRGILAPVKMLTNATRRIASGDLSGSVPVEGDDEISALARSFETMREKLKASYEENERWNRELEARVQQRTKELRCLFEVAQSMTSALGLEALLGVVAKRLVGLLEPSDAACLLLYDSKQQKLVAKAAAGSGSDVLSQLMLEPGEAFPGRVYQSGKGALINVPHEAELSIGETLRRCEPHLEKAWLDKPTSAICVPLVSKSQVMGVLLLIGFKSQTVFAESDLPLVQAIADQIALSIENARLKEEAEETRALREADRVKSQFISTVSHELRTPLTSIKGYTTSLLRQDVQWDGQTKQEFLQIIDEKSDELRDLIDKLLQMSKVEARALQIQKEPVLLNRLAQKIAEEHSSRTKRHTFVMDFPTPFPVVEADSRHISEVLHNLVENAIKYSPNGGQITVQGRIEDKSVVISVSDQGVGIAQEDLDKVFERFYRVDNELTRQAAGSGLGLSIAKGLVEAHGGRIWAESTPGKGSTFYFSLPLSEEIAEEDEGKKTMQPRGQK